MNNPWFESQVQNIGGVLSPGLLGFDPQVERYRVLPGGSQLLQLSSGDAIAIKDPQGLQQAQLSVFSGDGSGGSQDFGVIGATASGPASALIEALHDGSNSANRLMKALQGAGSAQGDLVATYVNGSRAGDVCEFIVHGSCMVVVCVGAGRMRPDDHVCATPIEVYVRRANIANTQDKLLPPDPLADTLLDENILPGHALAYVVKAGQYIQILDVQGRECSDFQAFPMRALDQQMERSIDTATTRSLNKSLYPMPGLYAKYFTTHQEPLVEVIRDTCGRHDTFGAACTARSYEELGYLGHVNCSDNISRATAKYGVAPRKSWPAINLFFNTMLGDNHAIMSDDPWSRPGDYVLLRALDDILCVSTACPSDTDATNAWNPTDIQVRVHDERNMFARSIGWRKTPGGFMEETQPTGFHEAFARFTREFIEYSGFWMAAQMTNYGTIAEYWATRERASIMDLSPLRKFEITGPDALTLLQHCVTRDIKKLSVGQVVYTAMCYPHGGMIDDGTVYRLCENNFRWVGGCDQGGEWLREQATELGLHAFVRDSTNQLCNVAVQGRIASDILDAIFWTAPDQPTINELQPFRFCVARIGDLQGIAVVISRTGYTGERGYEVFCHPKDAMEVFDRIWEVGEPMGLVPMGLNALDILRIEAGLVFSGYEFSDQTDPMEAGIGFCVPLKSKPDDFVGREALQRRKDNPQRKLVGLDIAGGIVPSSGDCVRIGRAQVGEVTSATKSPLLGRVIALARVDVAHCEIGTQVEIGQLDGQQKRLAANVVRFAHFDPTKQRVKGNYEPITDLGA